MTNNQYAAFVDATGHPAPDHWEGGKVPAGREDYPVVAVSWDDAVAYTEWLSAESGQAFRLPTEAEWEKACRGASGLIYPWGDTWDANKANITGTGTGPSGDTTPVGSYWSAGGDSPYGLADMAGNAWEWTSSQYNPYPYDDNDGREDLTEYASRMVRGGSLPIGSSDVRCAGRYETYPELDALMLGFRVGFSPPSPSGL